MSTKTTIKRIALVAVSALGFGLLSVVSAPMANALNTGAQATLGTPTSTVGIEDTNYTVVSVPVTLASGMQSGDTVTVTALVTSYPTGSVTTTMTAKSDTTAWTTFKGGAGTVTASNSSASTTFTVSAAATTVAGALTAKFRFAPDTAGLYTIAVFLDGDQKTATLSSVAASGAIKGTDTVKYVSVDVKTSPATTVVLSQPVAGTGAVYDSTTSTDGLVVKVSVKDAAGVASKISASQQLILSIPSGLTLRKKFGRSSTTGLSSTDTDYALIAADFDDNGNAWLNFTGASATTYNLTGKIGSAGTSTTLGLAYAAENAVATAGDADYANANTTAVGAVEVGNPSGYMTGTQASTVSTTATSSTFTVFAAAASVSKKILVEITDSDNLIWGNAAGLHAGDSVTDLVQDIVVTLGASEGAAGSTDGTEGKAYASFTVAHGALSKNNSGTARGFAISPESTDGTDPGTLVVAVTGVASSISATGSFQDVTPATTLLAINGASLSFTATYYDQYGVGKAGQAVTAYVSAGRNLQAVATNLVTNADGEVTFSYTDANPTSTTTSDTVTFTGGAADKNITVNYSATITATTMTMSPVTTSTAPSSVTIGSSTATAWKDDKTITATVKDANGSLMAGVPVTLTFPSDLTLYTGYTAVAYTDSTGVAEWVLGTTKAGSYKVTATGGGLTKDVYLKFVGGTVRVVTVTAGTTTNGVTPVTIKLADAYGNGVASTAVEIKSSGDGYFQGIALGASQTTTSDGTVSVAYVGNGTVTATYTAGGQTADVAGYVGTTAAAGFPAGSATASVTIDAASNPSSDATDAANEATDAANAATDAANAAAEAADAATAAAQDAQAAVAELATQVASLIAGIKAQITTLTNLVIKIQKKVKA